VRAAAKRRPPEKGRSGRKMRSYLELGGISFRTSYSVLEAQG